MTISKIAFRNVAQAALFECELKGQISDGAWENASNNPWQDWCSAEVVVDAENVGVEGYSSKNNYDFARRDLIDVVGVRMRSYVKMAIAGVPLSEIVKLVDGFCGLDGVFRGMPTHEGDYWDQRRAWLARWNQEWVREILDSNDYDEKALLEDLRDMKKIVRISRDV